MLHFLRAVRLCVLKAIQAYCYEKVRNYEKFYSSKALLKMAGEGGCICIPLDPPLVVFMCFIYALAHAIELSVWSNGQISSHYNFKT